MRIKGGKKKKKSHKEKPTLKEFFRQQALNPEQGDYSKIPKSTLESCIGLCHSGGGAAPTGSGGASDAMTTLKGPAAPAVLPGHMNRNQAQRLPQWRGPCRASVISGPEQMVRHPTCAIGALRLCCVILNHSHLVCF